MKPFTLFVIYFLYIWVLAFRAPIVQVKIIFMSIVPHFLLPASLPLYTALSPYLLTNEWSCPYPPGSSLGPFSSLPLPCACFALYSVVCPGQVFCCPGLRQTYKKQMAFNFASFIIHVTAHHLSFMSARFQGNRTKMIHMQCSFPTAPIAILYQNDLLCFCASVSLYTYRDFTNTTYHYMSIKTHHHAAVIQHGAPECFWSL